jgi:hypothetical protein
VEAEGWIALTAAVGAYGHIAWDAYAARRAGRSDVRIEVREEPAVVDSGHYVLTVVIANHGPATERIERVGLWFHDATGVFPPDFSVGEQGASQVVDADIEPRSHYRWTYDFADIRFRHGLGFRPWARLATGNVVDGPAGIVSEAGLAIAGLGRWIEPLPELED